MGRSDQRKPRKAVRKQVEKTEKKESKKVLKKPKLKKRVERLLANKAPKDVENSKNMLLIKGHATNQVVGKVLHDMNLLTKPNNKLMSRKNEILPFEDATNLEFLLEKNDCSLFAFVNHTKKRPNNKKRSKRAAKLTGTGDSSDEESD